MVLEKVSTPSQCPTGLLQRPYFLFWVHKTCWLSSLRRGACSPVWLLGHTSISAQACATYVILRHGHHWEVLACAMLSGLIISNGTIGFTHTCLRVCSGNHEGGKAHDVTVWERSAAQLREDLPGSPAVFPDTNSKTSLVSVHGLSRRGNNICTRSIEECGGIQNPSDFLRQLT